MSPVAIPHWHSGSDQASSCVLAQEMTDGRDAQQGRAPIGENSNLQPVTSSHLPFKGLQTIKSSSMEGMGRGKTDYPHTEAFISRVF